MEEDRWEVWSKHVLTELKRQGTIQRDQAGSINEMKTDIALIKQQTNTSKRIDMTKGGVMGTGLLSIIYAIYEFIINKNQ